MNKLHSEPFTSNLPFVSIIMPVRNEAGFIRRSLSAVFNQDYPNDHMELIMADGMSEDDTKLIIQKELEKNGHFSVNVLDNPGRIVPTGLNAALKVAKGDIIIRVDGHCEIAPDYVSRCVEHLQDDVADGVGGAIETIGLTTSSKAIAAAMSSPFGVGGSPFRTTKGKKMYVDTVPFPAYTRDILSRCGPFDEELVRNQDDEYNYRVRKLEGRILLAPDVRSRYYSRTSIRSLWRQYFQYGYWKVRVMQKHPRQMRPRQFVPPAFVTVLLGSVLLSPISPWAQAVFLLVCGSYVMTNLFVSLVTASENGWEKFPLLPIAFSTLHLSYGCGFLIGLVRFANRWRAQ